MTHSKRDLQNAINVAKKNLDAANAAEESVYARVGDECAEWEQANTLVKQALLAHGNACNAHIKAFPPFSGPRGDRGCGKSRR